jgi:beta-xylosidase
MRKQVDLNTTFSTRVDFAPTSYRHEAGVSIYLSIHFHNEIAVTVNNSTGKRAIVVKTRTGPDATLNATYIDDDPDVVAGKEVELYIEAKENGYRLGYKTDTGKEVRYLASVENKWLQTYVSG